MKIALVHDYLVQYGGAERVLEAFCEIFPHAPIYTLVYDEEAMHGKFSDKTIFTSFLQKIPFSRRQHRLFPTLMPSAIEQFDFSSYDVVLSDSASYAKGAITDTETLHICYMHTPMRYAWDDCQRYTQEFHFPRIIKLLVPLAMNSIRVWDKVSADRPDKILANSSFVADRIFKYYRRSSEVFHPPVSINSFFIDPSPDNYFLMVGRLISYKRHDIVIEAFNKLGLPLKIIGRGPEMKRLRKRAKSNIEFLGRVDDNELSRYYSKCKAFIFPQEEDFGIVAIEAMASGRPVIAYKGGDIPRHVEEGVTGVFFDEQTPLAVERAIKQFSENVFDANVIRNAAQSFDKELFKAKIKQYVEKSLEDFTKNSLYGA